MNNLLYKLGRILIRLNYMPIFRIHKDTSKEALLKMVDEMKDDKLVIHDLQNQIQWLQKQVNDLKLEMVLNAILRR